jgi:uncharacterized cupredoxin-like copper-binding protein
MMIRSALLPTALAVLLALPLAAAAHTAHEHKPRSGPVVKEQKPWGIAGEARDVRRTIRVDMSDDMRFKPDRIQVRAGETVRLVVRNVGGVLHELVIGTPEELKEHAELMRKFPNMEHDEPYMAHVSPGKTGEMVWNFNRPGTFNFACLIPGHFEAGMVGTIQVTAAPAAGRK